MEASAPASSDGRLSLPRIGCVKYVNARPLIRGWPGDVQFDHPSALCRQLAVGQLSAALVSSFEFLRNPVYTIVDNVAIASDGPVYSVFVAHVRGQVPREIEVDPASATGVALLRCLLAERAAPWGEHPAPADPLAELPSGRSRLLIGDQAIRFRQKFAGRYEYLDLGEEWRARTGGPFVFALWLLRPELPEAGELAEGLRERKAANLADLDNLIGEEKAFEADFLRFYYSTALCFDFGAREKEGLRLFSELCVKHSLLKLQRRDLRAI